MKKSNGKANVLVVDDLQSMRLTLGAILEDEGHNVVTVDDGYQAIEAAKKTHFDAIFMDIKMPGINGVETFREIKRINPEATVVMMTAYSVEDLVKEAMEEGAYKIVHKPFDIGRIIGIVQDLPHEKIRILVVDDRFADRETLKAILEDKGYRVATANDGAEAIEAAKEKHYDIIFLDINLPDIDGVQTFMQVRRINPTATVIMMTGYAEKDLVEQALSAGAYACLFKPFNVDKVIELVGEICRLKKK